MKIKSLIYRSADEPLALNCETEDGFRFTQNIALESLPFRDVLIAKLAEISAPHLPILTIIETAGEVEDPNIVLSETVLSNLIPQFAVAITVRDEAGHERTFEQPVLIDYTRILGQLWAALGMILPGDAPPSAQN